MLFCDSCALVKGWPTSHFKSYGACEICKVPRPCSDIQSKRLPWPSDTQPHAVGKWNPVPNVQWQAVLPPKPSKQLPATVFELEHQPPFQLIPLYKARLGATLVWGLLLGLGGASVYVQLVLLIFGGYLHFLQPEYRGYETTPLSAKLLRVINLLFFVAVIALTANTIFQLLGINSFHFNRP